MTKLYLGICLATLAAAGAVWAHVQSSVGPTSIDQKADRIKAVHIADLPEAVQKTIRQLNEAIGPTSIVSKESDGQQAYQVNFNHQGVHYSVLIAADGTLLGETKARTPLLLPLEDPETIALSDAPLAVQKVVRQEPDTFEITDIDQGKWRGQNAYELLLDKNGRPYQVIIAENGAVLYRSGKDTSPAGLPIKEAAGGIVFRDLPEPVQKTFTKETAGGKIRSVEKRVQNGRVVYHVQFERSGEPLHRLIAEDGTVLK